MTEIDIYSTDVDSIDDIDIYSTDKKAKEKLNIAYLDKTTRTVFYIMSPILVLVGLLMFIIKIPSHIITDVKGLMKEFLKKYQEK